MSELSELIRTNYQSVCQKISQAAYHIDRNPSDIKLVAVTKYVQSDVIRMLYDAGCKCFGESRPQSLWQKAEQLADLEIQWHLIGHLQRNKVAKTLPRVSMIHSADTLRLLSEIDRLAAQQQNTQHPSSGKPKLLLEVNISGDPSKHGFLLQQMPAVISEIAAFENIEIKGLMAMAAFDGGREIAEQNFLAMKNLQQQLAGSCPPQHRLKELSMGMSRDYEIAIKHGATIVRVGSALFEGVPRN